MIKMLSGPLTARLAAKWKAYTDDRRGATAVEFALIAAPFFFLIFGLMEVCLIFIMSTVMEHAVTEASREIRTGQAQQANMSESTFRTNLCDNVFGLMQDCTTKLIIEVQQLDGFASTSTALPVDEAGNITASNTFDAGGPNEVVSVRIFYAWDLITPIMSAPLVNMKDDKHLLQANAVFRNEPYGE